MTGAQMALEKSVMSTWLEIHVLKSFIKEIEQRFKMSDIEYRSCKTSAVALRNSEIELDKNWKE